MLAQKMWRGSGGVWGRGSGEICCRVHRLGADHRKQLREAEENHPTNLMTQDQMTTLTTELYIGKLQLDMNNYRAALINIQENAVAAEEACVAATGAHVTSVQAAQNHVCQSDIVFASPTIGGLTVPEGIHGLTAAVQEATRNLHRVSVLAGRQNSVAVFNVVSLPTHGMLSMKLLHAIRSKEHSSSPEGLPVTC